MYSHIYARMSCDLIYDYCCTYLPHMYSIVFAIYANNDNVQVTYAMLDYYGKYCAHTCTRDVKGVGT